MVCLAEYIRSQASQMEPYQHFCFSVISYIADKVRIDTVWVPSCGIRWLVSGANPSKEGFPPPSLLPPGPNLARLCFDFQVAAIESFQTNYGRAIDAR